MNSILTLGKAVTTLIVSTALTYPLWAAPAQAQRPNETSCRALREDTFIFTERSTSSTRVRRLGANEQVTLADTGANGWVAINSPTTGFVQASLLKPCSDWVGQCRAAAESTFIFDNPNATRIRRLAPEERVKLADDPREGWVAIEAPIAGFVRAVDLKLCSPNAQQPPPRASTPQQPLTPRPLPLPSNTCRQITSAVGDGLNVRAFPRLNAALVDTLAAGDVVRLSSNPPIQQIDDQGRRWLRIVQPIQGWLSDGLNADTSINLEPVACPWF